MFSGGPALHILEGWIVFRWMLFYLAIVVAIVAFVAFVLDIPIPGVTHTVYQPYQGL